MEQFAIVEIYPRSIAWLVKYNDEESLEKIVKYNCAVIGGYFNIIVPVNENGNIYEEYKRLLIDFDPDIIILPKGNAIISGLSDLRPFALINWNDALGIVSPNPAVHGSGMNVPPNYPIPEKTNNLREFIVAVEDRARPDASKFAFMACGDLDPAEPMWDEFDGEIDLYAGGYRENLLWRALKPGSIPMLVGAHKSIFDKIYNKELNVSEIQHSVIDEITPAPDRKDLADLIQKEKQFPLSDPVKILDICCSMQYFPSLNDSFINLTTYHKGGSLSRQVSEQTYLPGLVLLFSNHFEFDDAVLFWNLRASGVLVVWLSFSDLENNIESTSKWLNSDLGGVFYSNFGTRDIVFSTHEDEIGQLQRIFKILQEHKSRQYPQWRILSRSDLVIHKCSMPPMKRDRILVVCTGSKCSFVPKLPDDLSTGIISVALEWNGLMLPKSKHIVNDCISHEEISCFFPLGSRPIGMPKFRISRNHILKVQIEGESEIEFEKPLIDQIIRSIFVSAGFSAVKISSTGKYHIDYIKRSNSLKEAAKYLGTSPYREFLSLLADKKDIHRTGWLLKNLDRRVLNHLQLRDALGKETPFETKDYFNSISDDLPAEAIELLEKRILERGFRLKCNFCSYDSWYPADEIGQEFKCSRCYNSQVYKSNPLWLYKLAEATFQGFECNMEVPILALNYLKSISKRYFEWIPDLDIYWDGKNRNIDLVCIIDGKLFLGEAKDTDKIERNQIEFYETLCKKINPDGLVFATSKAKWSKSTSNLISKLKNNFTIEIIEICSRELYSSYK